MTIDKIGGMFPENYSKKAIFQRKSEAKIKDLVNISSDAKAMQKKSVEVAKLNNEVVRNEKITQAKANLDKYFLNGELSEQVASKVADKIVDSLLLR